VLPGGRAASDLRADLHRLAAGDSLWQLSVGPAGVTADSNVTYAIVQVRVTHRHRLGAGELERDWTEDELATLLDTLVRPSWWRAQAGVHSVESPPEYTTVRTGPVIVATLEASLSLYPA
jgi:hypothetical protein